jgi:hypothetical protein
MATFDLFAFKTFCRDTIESKKWWRTAVPVALLDVGLNTIYQTTVCKNEQGVYLFENETSTGAVNPPGPFTAQFTIAGKPVLINFPTA